jgi:hypothetical protein
MMRVEAARRIFPRCWFNEKNTEAGRDALGYYHERRDENRNVGLGPDHDWSSHAADCFGYMAISYEEPPVKQSEASRRSGNTANWQPLEQLMPIDEKNFELGVCDGEVRPRSRSAGEGTWWTAGRT